MMMMMMMMMRMMMMMKKRCVYKPAIGINWIEIEIEYTTSAVSAGQHGHCRSFFQKIARLVGRLGSEPRLVGQLGQEPASWVG